MFAEKKFKSSDKVIAATKAYFGEDEKSYYKSGIEKLENRCTILNNKIEFCQNFVSYLSYGLINK